jgi:hypothetical protein
MCLAQRAQIGHTDAAGFTRRAIRMSAVGVSALVFACVAAAQQPSSSPYHIVKTITLDSAGADFLTIDQEGRRLFGVGTVVIDVDSAAIIGHVPLHTGWSIAIDRRLGVGIGRLGVIFDAQSLGALGHVDVHADGVAYDPLTHRAFLLDDTVTVVDLQTRAAVGKIGLTEGAAVTVESGVADGNGRLYLNDWYRRDANDSIGVGQILVINTRTLAIEAKWVFPTCYVPQGIALDKKRNRLMVGCAHMLEVVEVPTGRLVTTLPLPGHVDQFGFDEAHHTLFCPDGKGHILIVRENGSASYAVQGQIDVGEGGSAVAFDPKSRRLFTFQRKNDYKIVDVIILAPNTESANAGD